MIKYSILFFINREKDRDDAALRVKVKWGNESCTVNIGYRINPDRWNSELHRCTPKSYHGKKKISATIINEVISDTENRVDSFFVSAFNIPSIEDVKNVVKNESKSEDILLVDAIDMYIRESTIEKAWTNGTVENMITTRNYVKEFNKNAKVNDVTYEFMMSFLKFMYSKDLGNVYIKNKITVFKCMIRWMKLQSIYNGDILDRFKPKIKTIDREVIYLTWEELNLLMNVETKNSYEESAKDGFLLQCFTGLRYSDLKNLKKNDVHPDCISITTIKTNDPLIIELNSFSKAILEKHKNDPGIHAIRVYTNNNMNDMLRKLSKRAGIDTLVCMSEYRGAERVEKVRPKYELITTHCGRRTFVVNAMFLNISDSVIMSWTGHSSVESMRPYRKVIDESKKRDMAKFDTLSVTDVTKKQ